MSTPMASKAKTESEHLLFNGHATAVNCSCGKKFGIEALARQHQWWNLQLTALTYNNSDYVEALGKQADFQERALKLLQRVVKTLPNNNHEEVSRPPQKRRRKQSEH